EGEDDRWVYVLIGLELFDANGTKLAADGCPASQGGYSISAPVNETGSITGEGTTDGAGLTKTWSMNVPSNAATVFLEVYPKTRLTDPPGATDKVRYGSILRHDIPVRSNLPLVLPLNCGLTGGGVTGTNGSIIGTVTRNGSPVTPDRVSVWTLEPDTDLKPLGWGIAEVVSGGFRAEALPGDARYQIFVTQGGETKRVLWVPLNSCQETQIDVRMGSSAPDTVAGATFYLSNSLASGPADITTVFGRAGDTPVVGDWDGNGWDDIGVRRGARFEVRYGTGPGYPSKVFGYGRPGDQLYTGDWDGNGTDTLAVRRGNVFHLRNDTNSGPATTVLGFGTPTDEVFVGDWNGDGRDTFAVRRGNVFFLRNDLLSGPGTTVFGYGRVGDEVLVGDWDGDGRDTLAVRRGAEYFLRNDTQSGPAQVTLAYGRADDVVFVGDWNGDGVDTFGVHR
ncbi:MAG: hypothetical protein OEU32_15275, partial [Acidimicrobiia bacterium]|nr:hypothetical protein [Acidimicrobiia bacterium]